MTTYFGDIEVEPKSILGADSDGETLEKTMDEQPKTSPKFSKSFLEFMESTFDIRKSINYEDSIEKLKGIQEVISYMRYLYENAFKLNY